MTSLCSLTLAQILGGCGIFSSPGFEKKPDIPPLLWYSVHLWPVLALNLMFWRTWLWHKILSPPEIRLYPHCLKFREMLSAFPRLVVGTMHNSGEITMLPIPGSNKKQDDCFSPFITRVCLCVCLVLSVIYPPLCMTLLLVIYLPICVILSVFCFTLFACTCQLWTDLVSLVSA